jgi:ATP-dependent exoDNAse (exonuclease V) beta subunit
VLPSPPAAPAPPIAQRLVAEWRPTGLPGPVAVSGLELSLRETGVAPEYSWVGLTGRAVGTVVHAELQRLAAGTTLPATPDADAADYHGWLTELGVPAVELDAASARITATLAAALRDPRGRWLLQGEPGRAAYSELRLSGLHEGRVVNISIDRLLTDAAGDRWIVDYKTGTHEGGDIAGFLTREAERYRPQLARYAELVAALMPDAAGARVRVALYFPMLGELRELDLAGPPR